MRHKKRDADICRMILDGATYDLAGAKYRLTRERARQIFRKTHPDFAVTGFGRGVIKATCDLVGCNKEYWVKRSIIFKRQFCSRQCAGKMRHLKAMSSETGERNQRAYLLRTEGKAWLDIVKKLGYTNEAIAINSAKRCAQYHKWEWPVRLPGTSPRGVQGGYVAAETPRLFGTKQPA